MAIEIKIGASFNDRDIKRAQRELDNLKRAADQMSQTVTAKMARTGESFSRMGETLSTKLTLPLVALGTLSVKAFTEQEDAIAKMEAVLKSTGGVAGVTSTHVTDLASSLQKTTTFADEVTVNGAALLLTFKNIRNEMGDGNDVFDRTIKASQDLSALMGTDLNTSVMMLGKALQDPETGLTKLTRAGIQFSDQQKDQIKTLAESGDMLGAQKIMLGEIESQFGGTAEAMAQTAAGRLKQAFNELGEAAEAIGAQLAPAIEKVAEFLSWIGRTFASLPDGVKTVITILGGFAAALGPALWITGNLLTNLSTIGKTKIGTALIDGFNTLRTSISNAVAQAGSLTGAIRSKLTPAFGLATVAAVGFAIGLSELNKKFMRDAREQLSGLTGDLSALRVAMTEAAQTGRIIDPLSKATIAFANLRGEAEELNDVFFGERHGQFNIFETIRSSVTDTGEKADEARLAISNVDVALTEMFKVDSAGAERIFGKVIEMGAAAGFSVEEVSAMLPGYTELTEAANSATGGFAGAFGDVEDEVSSAEQALKDYQDEIRGHFDPVFAVMDANKGLVDSNKAVEDAVRGVIDAETQFGINSPEAIAARNLLKDADLNATQAALDLKFAQEQMQIAIQNGGTSAETAAGMLEGLIANQGLNADAANRVRTEFFNMIAQMNLTPTSIAVTISTNAGQVLTDMATIAKGMDILGPGPWSLESAFRAAVGLPRLAVGGAVQAGMPHIVGERGSELFIPSTDGVIVPHYASRRMMDDQPAQTQQGPARTGDVYVTVNKTDASPYDIGRELLWTMKVAG